MSAIIFRVALLATAFFVASCSSSGTSISATSESPDGNWQARIVELNAGIDRNFAVQVRNKSAQTGWTEIFRSPDEGRPAGQEKFTWSSDSLYFLLTGPNLFVAEEGKTSGDQLYLLYGVKTGELWCNASQTDAPRFTADIVRAKGIALP